MNLYMTQTYVILLDIWVQLQKFLWQLTIYNMEVHNLYSRLSSSFCLLYWTVNYYKTDDIVKSLSEVWKHNFSSSGYLENSESYIRMWQETQVELFTGV